MEWVEDETGRPRGAWDSQEDKLARGTFRLSQTRLPKPKREKNLVDGEKGHRGRRVYGGLLTVQGKMGKNATVEKRQNFLNKLKVGEEP